MKILVKFNKNIATPKQVKSFKVFNIGVVLTTINDLLDSATIEIDDQTLPVIKLTDNSLEKYYLINDVGLTPGLTYPYYTDDFMKEITIEDLILINTGGGEENAQSDWNQTNVLLDDYIKNKPTSISEFINDLNFATETYVDTAISNIPTGITNHSDLILDDGTNPHGTTKSDVGLSNVDNTSDISKPISTATQTALNNKQDTLVNTSNIKSINGNSILGSGDLIINGHKRTVSFRSVYNGTLNSATNSWWTTLSGLTVDGAMSIVAALTPADNFAALAVQSPGYVVPFNCRLKSITVKGFSNTGQGDIDLALVSGTNLGVGVNLVNTTILSNQIFNTQNYNGIAGMSQFLKVFDTGFTNYVIPKGYEIRIVMNNRNVAKNLLATTIMYEFEEEL